MRWLKRRLDRLDQQLGVGPETWEQRQTRERAEEFRTRLDAARARTGLPPLPPASAERSPGPRRSMGDIMVEARKRATAELQAQVTKAAGEPAA